MESRERLFRLGKRSRNLGRCLAAVAFLATLVTVLWHIDSGRTRAPSGIPNDSSLSGGASSPKIQSQEPGSSLTAGPSAANISSLSAVPLALHLVATHPGRNAFEGYADVGVDPRSPQTYRVGALLANGARIEEVYSDHVVLARHGRRTNLYLEGENSRSAVSRQETIDENASMRTVGGPISVAAATADSHDALTDYIRVAPVFEGDRIRSLEVYGNGRSDVFQRLGLEGGDLITEIDGAEVANQGVAVAALRQLTSGRTLSVTVLRGGDVHKVQLDGAVVVNAIAGT